MRWLFAFLVLSNAGWAAEVSATRVDGSSIRGELKHWDDKVAVLETDAGEQRVSVKELLSLRWQAAAGAGESGSATVPSQLELSDGSVLPVSEFRSDASRATITPAAGGGERLRVPKGQVAAVRLQPLSAELAEQWDDIRELKPAADVVVVLTGEGKGLDYAEGVVGEVSPENVAFELDGATRKVDRAKIAGLIYFRRDSAAQPESRLVVLGRNGLKVNVARAELRDNVLRMTTAGGATLDWPLEEIYLADYSAGKLVYLSDLEPASMKAAPLVAFPKGAALVGKYSEPRRDQSAFGGPLSLSAGEEHTSSTSALRRTFDKGLAIRSRTELVYRLPAGFRRLSATAGIDPATRASGDVRLEILGDDQSLFEAQIKGTDPPSAIDLDIADVKRLTIVVDYSENLDTGDWLNLCDLRVVK